MKTTNRGKSLTRRVTPANGTGKPPTDWNSIDWKKANGIVRRLRQRIFRATQEGDLKKVHSLQKLMVRSRSNILTAVRRVTQVNDGKKTPGVDKLTVKTPTARGRLVDDLSTHTPWKARPARRVYIPKANGRQRPLGIPVIKDRALQAMVKNALEPSWEARFEGASYGFRPGRGCHDAIAKIYGFARPNKTKKWVVDADIKGAFDNICHEHLLAAIGPVPGRELIRQWLKAGYVEEEVWHPTETGTPQGGVISPLLANIALHGMEEALGVKYYRKPNGDENIVSKRGVVRYADDFVVFCETQKDAEDVLVTLSTWLADRGLKLSEEKTRIVHLTEGFDFLGFNIRHYKATKTKSGWKLLIKPSKKKVQETRESLREKWIALKGHNIGHVIKTLNPIIRGWANYFRVGVSSKTFRLMDHWMFKRAQRWAKFTHPNKPIKWHMAQYWGRFNLERQDYGVFGDKRSGAYLTRFAWTPIERHIMVKGRYSADDPSLKLYWAKRRLDRCKDLRLSDRKIVVRQKGICPVCRESLFNGEDTGLFAQLGEEIHRHHHTARSEGGGNQYRNLHYLHLYCHQQTHARKGSMPVTDVKLSTKEITSDVRANLKKKLALPEDFEWMETAMTA